MPAYVPPAGNAVQFNFTGIYVPPAGNAVALDFVFGSPGSGAGTDQLPVARRLMAHLFYEEEWASPVRRRFAPADGYGGELQPPHQRHAPLWQRFEEQPQLPWKRRRTFADASALYRRKRAAQIIG
jgi:hypothetical protein